MIRNDKNELGPTQVQYGCRVCINYRKLNDATRKDHFPLPSFNWLMERLAGHSFYYFLDGSGYIQISIAPKVEDKTIFTCLFRMYTFTRMRFELSNGPATFQRYMISIFSDLVE